MITPTKPWDNIFKEQGYYFDEPHEAIPGVVRRLHQQQARTVLDLGSGSGRHVVYLAEQGFEVYGLDNSPEGLRLTEDWLTRQQLAADLRLGDMTEPLPYADNEFDALISVHVIHHADIATIKRLIGEIERVLKPGGLLFISVPKNRNQAENFEEIEPNTLVPLDGMEQGLPHHFFTPAELHEVFANFSDREIQLDTKEHYCLTGYLRG